MDRLRGEGFVATCGSGGGLGRWSSTYSRYLRDRAVVILPDNDVVGQKHAAGVATGLYGTVLSLRILNLPDLRWKGDVSDWLDAGGTPSELRRLAAQVPEYRPRLELHYGRASDDGDWWTLVARGQRLENVLNLRSISAPEKLLLVILTAGVERPMLTQRAIAECMGLTPRRVKQLIVGLRERGILETARLRKADKVARIRA